ncbi:MAG: YidC/Oxa1 family membrane protein insertase [Tissierellia bacterium]|jgi:YidC/Oxa1 family membrane protein insertase|nr:YidC/Oxa1 family membrane protein insertase [Tissierellia bacterium]
MRFINQFMGMILRMSYDLVSSIIPGDSKLVSNYAIAILLLALIIKIITIPLTMKQSKSMAKSRALQPKIKELQEKYGNDAQTIARKQQELYKEEGVNPMGGCLPLLIQLPILMAMWNVVRQPELYAFTEPGMYEAINKSFFWLSNLNEVDVTLIMPIAAAGISFLNQKLMMSMNQPATTGNKEQDAAMQQSNNMMGIMMPVMMFFIYRSLPAVLPFYMIISMGLSSVVQYFVNKQIEKEFEQEGERTK